MRWNIMAVTFYIAAFMLAAFLSFVTAEGTLSLRDIFQQNAPKNQQNDTQEALSPAFLIGIQRGSVEPAGGGSPPEVPSGETPGGAAAASPTAGIDLQAILPQLIAALSQPAALGPSPAPELG